ncbi:hypothetical protein [Legionella sainthelensi]|uniref:Uncharacterized protein n=1 Tax=Legionella sainthelensi TaxID=28087 RepID=A0A2H5FL17_9GAMM|nr:hypothetical protein [Legionella sainthelensi]AUH72255.1 hypothetical protein CAB17_09415 [Legionella sainthelensi]
MTKEKHQHKASYLPLRNQARFWVHSEACYTEEELNQRRWILKTRSNSGIYADYLANPSSWFADDSQALINVYEHSWFYSNAYKTRHVLTRDDFHVQPIDSQRIQWSALYDLMQRTGDYLLLRNNELRQEHLNQPINFFLLDLNHILKGISQNPNIKQTQEQLEHLTRYVRAVEKNISPFIGSDRLFLANFRNTIETQIQPQLTQMIDSQLLKDRLGELSKTIKQLSADRNRILHFALNINPVNPHPYTFAIDQPDDLQAYPTQAVKECGKSTTALVEKNPISTLKLTIEQLKNCPNFQLIDMQDKILDHYAKAVSDLHELDQFQTVISQTIDLLGQAGEVYTVYQFKEQLFSLLDQIELFIDESSIHIDEIIQANTQAYHQAIQHEQNLSFLKKWLTNEREKLNTFIHNQDTLAQFPSTTTDLIKTNQALKEHVRQVIIHLNAPKAKTTNFETIAGKTQELNALINSMHQWVTVQHELKGLQPPKKPQEIKRLSSSLSSSHSPLQSKSNPSFFQKSPQQLPASDMCFISKSYENHVHETYQPLSINSGSGNPIAQQCRIQPCEPTNNYYWGLLALLPIGLLALYCLYRLRNESETSAQVPGNKEDYEKIKTQVEDVFVEIQKVKDKNNLETEYAYENFEETYHQLDKNYQAHNYQVEALKELLGDLKYFYNEYYHEAKSNQRLTY